MSRARHESLTLMPWGSHAHAVTISRSRRYDLAPTPWHSRAHVAFMPWGSRTFAMGILRPLPWGSRAFAMVVSRARSSWGAREFFTAFRCPSSPTHLSVVVIHLPIATLLFVRITPFLFHSTFGTSLVGARLRRRSLRVRALGSDKPFKRR